MKLVWSPDTASKAYIDTCERIKESGAAELLSAMAAGWNAQLIVEARAHGGPITSSIALAVAARHTRARHVCIVPDESSRLAYVQAMYDACGGGGDVQAAEVMVGEAEEVMGELKGVDFLLVDCKRKDFARVLRLARFSNKGAVIICKNACQRNSGWFRWQGALQRGTRVVRSVFLPVGKGLDMVHVGSCGLGESLKKNHSRWIKHVDQRSGEEHVFRGSKT